jgi:hypothetical protein
VARYGKSFKNKAVMRVLPPQSETLEDVAREIGIGAATLERWRSASLLLAAGEQSWTAAARFDAVLSTAALDEASKSAWCRSNGVYPQDLAAWQQRASDSLAEPHTRASSQQTREERSRIKELERALLRKDRALAECAALLVLSKKVAAIFHTGEDE